MNAEKTNYDLLYNPRLTVTAMRDIFARWDRGLGAARARLDCYLDVPYGSDATERWTSSAPRARAAGS